MQVTAHPLNGVLGLDHVIRVHADGTVTEPEGVQAAEAYDDGGETRISSEGRSVLTACTGQHGYNGPVMHASEYIGDGPANANLPTPGLYMAVTVLPTEGSDELAGCAVAYREGT